MKARVPAGSRRGSEDAGGATLAVRVQPRAAKNGIVRMQDGSLKIRLTAPPVDGAANEALIAFLSETFAVSRSSVEIISGQSARQKIIRVSGISEGDVDRLLNNQGQ